MNKTAVINTQQITPNLASLYTTNLQNVYNSGMWNDIYLNDMPAAGGIVATMTDMFTYGQKWLESTAKDAWTPNEVSGYGMGWVIQNVIGDRPSGSQVVWHTGGTQGCSSILVIYPETEIIVAASVNLAENPVGDFIGEGIIADLFATSISSRVPISISIYLLFLFLELLKSFYLVSI